MTPTDRPKSVRNRCVIESFGCVFVLTIGFRVFCWYRGFRHRSESDLQILLQRKCWTIIYLSMYSPNLEYIQETKNSIC